jgi:Reverse transcriptase (RNA-dependent DNA polymerase)
LTLKEALSGPDAKFWRSALTEELQSLADNDVYDIVLMPEGVTPITSKPVMHIKLDKNGDIEHHKHRIVARGFTQKEDIDYQEVFAPVANLESIRIIISLAAKYDLELDQMDVATAYLNGKLEEEIYLQPPDGVPITPRCCWRLKQSLYGLK